MKPPPSTRLGSAGVVEHAGLAGRDAFLGRVEHHGRPRRPRSASRAGDRLAGRAHAGQHRPAGLGGGLDASAASPSQLVSFSVRARVSSASRGPTITWRLSASMPDHEQRVADGDVQAPALADGVAGDALVAAQHAAVQVDDVAGAGAVRAQRSMSVV